MTKNKYVPHAWETVNCPYCNSSKSKIYERFGSELQFTYVKCSDCGLIYQTPRPKYDDIFLLQAYEEYFYYDENFKYSDENFKLWDKELHEILKYDKRKTAILDIGSCMGDFLKVAQQYYPKCTGVEIAENMAKYTEKELKINVFVGSYVDINFKEKYSCIHMSHVIEHIPNPHEWLLKTKELLDDNGVLVMSVPNMKSLDRRFKLFLKRIGLRKGMWQDNTRTPDHLFEPTAQSTLKFFENNGFKILKYYTYSRKDMDVSTFFGKIYNRKLKLGSNLRFFVTPV
ncbi:MAG TPA: class I SAM-dependent methyltransferase [Bacteroidales bacterium]|nr:class I SAM-dependent methyltransferase [Bacteroidales bacterium]